MNQVLKGLAFDMAVILAAAGAMGAAMTAYGDTQVRDVKGFDKVSFALPGKLTLRKGDAFHVEVDAAPEDLDRIETEVRGDELSLRWKEGLGGLLGGHSKGPVAVRVTLPALVGLELAGSGDVDGGDWLSDSFSVVVRGSGDAGFGALSAEDLDVDVAGSGNVDIKKVDSGSARVEIRGSGDVTLEGAADRQKIQVMGSGDVHAKTLEGARVDVEIMGSGDVEVWANDDLTAHIMGSGDVRYRGQPKVNAEQHGSGRVRAL